MGSVSITENFGDVTSENFRLTRDSRVRAHGAQRRHTWRQCVSVLLLLPTCAIRQHRTICYLSLCTGKSTECWTQPCGIIKISARITHGSVVVIFPTGFCLQKEEHRCRAVVGGGGGFYSPGLQGLM
jgi:hypothetical protein